MELLLFLSFYGPLAEAVGAAAACVAAVGAVRPHGPGRLRGPEQLAERPAGAAAALRWLYFVVLVILGSSCAVCSPQGPVLWKRALQLRWLLAVRRHFQSMGTASLHARVGPVNLEKEHKMIDLRRFGTEMSK